MDKEKIKNKVISFHDKHYKSLLLISLLLLISSFAYIGYFYSVHHDFINKDISLTGGTSVTINEKVDLNELKSVVSGKLDSVTIREISDLVTREQIAVIVETKSDEHQTRNVLEDFLGYELNEENSSFEFTGSTLSESFFKQLLLAIIWAFSLMGLVVFFIFNKNNKIRLLLSLLVLISPILFFLLKIIDLETTMIISLLSLGVSIYFYIRQSIPSAAVIFSAFADIIMTITVVNLLGIQISTAGIVAVLMLIGYSVDTDILLTSKVLKGNEDSLNKKIFESFKTGITMTLTSIVAVLLGLIIVGSFSVVLSQIFTIMAIGLSFDIFNTWITNVSILKWYVLRKKKNEN